MFIQTAEFSLSAARLLPRAKANTLINFVPQQQAWVVERFGRYLRTLQPVRMLPHYGVKVQ